MGGQSGNQCGGRVCIAAGDKRRRSLEQTSLAGDPALQIRKQTDAELLLVFVSPPENVQTSPGGNSNTFDCRARPQAL